MSSFNDNADPYEVLGVAKDATTAQIKSAYRKLALKFHPDKQKGSEEDKARATSLFTKIGNAYEILSDEDARRRYDATANSGARRSNGGYRNSSHGNHDPFQDFFAHDPFFRRSHRHGFTDPFEIFEQVFSEQFGMGNFGRSSKNQRSGGMRSPFDDPFFSDPFGGMDDSPFGMMDRMMGRHRSAPFGMMDEMMGSMGNVHQQMRSNSMRQVGGPGRASSFTYSSSSSGSGGFGARESVSTTTQIINGKRQTVTERTVVRPDGSVERHIETSGDDDFPQRRTIAGDRQNVPSLANSAAGSFRTRRSSKRSSSSRF
mmetsp:Transcript_14179/g.17847  ORF Transcript_14179/g.17847 Transcript_14179/m.17847 type:complete len:315 (+) Transcript_14179:170-1114(+)|eukprot:CAMPEP_0172498924 /NCGR_PEP_ID=MMETSP1066-20121228/119606_1 /TAXON_ID=671091 /ORGANISM="Coscinodiscus wailesii, Strain CCMP2513" /LENGTH=314 /DNA_ID=CAMNT_0013272409 /DNA_START=166 /DNA_END=1110 /DNA_ORIENTATION=+